jgi:hypothetical protein
MKWVRSMISVRSFYEPTRTDLPEILNWRLLAYQTLLGYNLCRYSKYCESTPLLLSLCMLWKYRYHFRYRTFLTFRFNVYTQRSQSHNSIHWLTNTISRYKKWTHDGMGTHRRHPRRLNFCDTMVGKVNFGFCLSKIRPTFYEHSNSRATSDSLLSSGCSKFLQRSTSNSIGQNPSWEAYSRSATRKLLPFCGTWRFIQCSQETATGPYPEPHEAGPQFPAF